MLRGYSGRLFELDVEVHCFVECLLWGGLGAERV
jgi:hypothetical protein